MKLECKKAFRAFLSCEDGAVTVDWVVLTAAVAGLAMMVAAMLEPVLFDSAATGITGVIQQAAQR